MLQRLRPRLDGLAAITAEWKSLLDKKQVPKYVIDMPERKIRWLTLLERTELLVKEVRE